MTTTVLSNHPGPLPIKLHYTPRTNRPVTLIFSGSVQPGAELLDKTAGFEVKVNGKKVGESMIREHKSDTHQATITAMADTTLPFEIKDDKVEPVTIELDKMNIHTHTNEHDHFNLCIID